ncbi:MAG: 3-phosphoshikimate 1-carboxyvinyltransferase [Spirochaetales bacterium]|nr:3-phosphoshikimate 1-carboxyvinyltransferase [Spirochaetales bacterium]
MKFLVNKTNTLSGDVRVPGNKSGTARSIILGSLASGTSRIHNPLLNIDSFSVIKMFRDMGVNIDTSNPELWSIEGSGGNLKIPAGVLDAENSGTGFYMVVAIASLINGCSVVTGDYQICYRPAGPQIDALNALGADIYSTRNSGLAPLVIRGVLKGGNAELPGINSQWLSPLLVACSQAENDTVIKITDEKMLEHPYINMTIGMLKQVGVIVEHSDDYLEFRVKGKQEMKATDFHIPADWGTSGYPMIASAITNSKVTFHNLNTEDYAGEKAYVDILKKMGAKVDIRNNGKDGITVEGTDKLQGIEIDCSGTPDAVPILAVLGCKAQGKTVLKNVDASRLKETDRTAIIRKELEKMGGRFEETRDSLTIYHSDLKGTFIDGHHDHRIVMATSIAALIADGPTIIDHAEFTGVSYPGFYETMKSLGANIERLEVVE